MFTYDFLQQLLAAKSLNANGKNDDTLLQAITVQKVECPESLRKQPIVVILDEFNVYRNKERNESKSSLYINYQMGSEIFLRFVRNLFRSLKWVVVLMGTDSSVANLVVQSNASRCESDPWCFVYHKLPRFVVPDNYKELYNERCSQFPSLSYILHHSRPWFSLLTLGVLRDLNQTLDLMAFQEVIKRVASMVFDKKGIFFKDGGRYGQVALFLNMAYSENHSRFMHEHFGDLILDEKTNAIAFEIDSFSFGLRSNSAKNWNPSCRFANVCDDTLLYLCLMGLPGIDAIRDSAGVSLPYMTMALELDNMTFNRGLDVRNSQQKSNSGEHLEAFGVGAFIVASHAHGFQGISLVDFLPHFVYHMGLPSFTFGKTVTPETWHSFRIPFLAPPNQDWPTSVYDISGGWFGRIERLPNKERIDSRVYCNNRVGFALEMKDYSKKLPKSTLKHVLENLSLGDPVVFIITNQMQKSYQLNKQDLSNKAWENLQDSCIWVIQPGDDDQSTISVLCGFENCTLKRPIICICRK